VNKQTGEMNVNPIENWARNRRLKREKEQLNRKNQEPKEHAAEIEAYNQERIKLARKRGVSRALRESRGKLAGIQDVFQAINKSAEAGNILIWGDSKGPKKSKDEDWW